MILNVVAVHKVVTVLLTHTTHQTRTRNEGRAAKRGGTTVVESGGGGGNNVINKY